MPRDIGWVTIWGWWSLLKTLCFLNHLTLLSKSLQLVRLNQFFFSLFFNWFLVHYIVGIFCTMNCLSQINQPSRVLAICTPHNAHQYECSFCNAHQYEWYVASMQYILQHCKLQFYYRLVCTRYGHMEAKNTITSAQHSLCIKALITLWNLFQILHLII